MFKRGHIDDLATGGVYRFDSGKPAPAGGALRRSVNDDLVGAVAHEQDASVMSSLPACFASGRSAQRNRLFGEGVALRWLAAVVAVGVLTVFEEFDACAQGDVLFLQNDNLPLQSRDRRENGVGSLVIERLECVTCEHIGFHESQTQRVAPMLRVFCPKMGLNSY